MRQISIDEWRDCRHETPEERRKAIAETEKLTRKVEWGDEFMAKQPRKEDEQA